MTVEAVFAEGLPMVADEEDQGVVEHAPLPEGPEEPCEGTVERPQRPLVRPLGRVPGGDGGQVAGVLAEPDTRDLPPVRPAGRPHRAVRLVGLEQVHEELERCRGAPPAQVPLQGAGDRVAVVEQPGRPVEGLPEAPERAGLPPGPPVPRRGSIRLQGLVEAVLVSSGLPGTHEASAQFEGGAGVELVEVRPEPRGGLDEIVGREGHALPAGVPPRRGQGGGGRGGGGEDTAGLGGIEPAEEGEVGGEGPARAGHEPGDLPAPGGEPREEGHRRGQGGPGEALRTAPGVGDHDHEMGGHRDPSGTPPRVSPVPLGEGSAVVPPVPICHAVSRPYS
jgi:translation initiation factor IF-2